MQIFGLKKVFHITPFFHTEPPSATQIHSNHNSLSDCALIKLNLRQLVGDFAFEKLKKGKNCGKKVFGIHMHELRCCVEVVHSAHMNIRRRSGILLRRLFFVIVDHWVNLAL